MTETKTEFQQLVDTLQTWCVQHNITLKRTWEFERYGGHALYSLLVFDKHLASLALPSGVEGKTAKSRHYKVLREWWDAGKTAWEDRANSMRNEILAHRASEQAQREEAARRQREKEECLDREDPWTAVYWKHYEFVGTCPDYVRKDGNQRAWLVRSSKLEDFKAWLAPHKWRTIGSNFLRKHNDKIKRFGGSWNGSIWLVPQRNYEAAMKIVQVDANVLTISRGEGYGGYPYKVGSVIRAGAEVVRVVDTWSKYFREDGLSFGVGDDSGYIYYAHVVPASDEERNKLETRERAVKERQTLRQEFSQLLDEHFLRATDGERPPRWAEPIGELVPIGDGQNIYGGGSWFVVSEEFVWYVRNNGADGDAWDNNNVHTGGAGAIGVRYSWIPERRRAVELAKAGVQPI